NLDSIVFDINTWLECDAGFLTESFEELHSDMPCSFDSCCCGSEINKETILDKLNENSIKEDQLKNIFEDSLDVLNNVLAGANSCTEQIQEDVSSYSCFIDYQNSKFFVRNDYVYDVSDEIRCQDPSLGECFLKDFGSDGGFGAWY